MGNASVLVVDDNKIMRDMLRGILEPEGYSVNSCEEGPSALKLASEKQFEIVLTDFQMPGRTVFRDMAALQEAYFPVYQRMPS